MKSRQENVIAAIEFSRPDRLPMGFEAFGVSDMYGVGWNQIGTGDITKKLTFDEWNCGWSRSDVKNMGQVTVHPIDDWSKLDSFEWPDPDDPAFYEGMEEKFRDAEDRYILTGIFMVFFERLHSLRGFQNLLLDFFVEREKIENLADRVADVQIGIIEQISSRFSGRIDGFHFTDDWGTEKDTFISPELFNDFVRPRYERIFGACKNAGWHVWLHSCGKINKFIPDLIDLGVDVLNLLQPRVLGIEEIGKNFAGKVCFNSLCDIQRTLPFETADVIVEEAHSLIENWGTDSGGFILSDYGDDEAISVAPEKKRIMYDAFLNADRWKTATSV